VKSGRAENIPVVALKVTSFFEIGNLADDGFLALYPDTFSDIFGHFLGISG